MSSDQEIEHFPHPFYRALSEEKNVCYPRVIDDLIVQKVSCMIRAKPDWTTKYNNGETKKNWIAEMEGQLKIEPDYSPLHSADTIWKFIFEELEWYDKWGQETGFTMGPNENVLFSDCALDGDFRESLKKLVYEKLEDVPEDSKDWRPRSDNQVLDLIHPSLYPLQYGKTKVMTEKRFEVSKMIVTKDIPKYTHCLAKDYLSEDYQWLPSIFHVSKKDGGYDVDIQSYINNLDPMKYGNLYPLISSVFAKAVPGLNLLLTYLSNLERLRAEYPRYTYDPEVNYGYDDYWTDEIQRSWNCSGCESLDTEENDRIHDLYERREDYIDKSMFPLEFNTPACVVEKELDLADFGHLKVITKLSNIHLTPENPSYPGGPWQVEGKINEDIVAIVFYYYDSKNIGDSKVSLRNATISPYMTGFDGDEVIARRVFGIRNGDRLARFLGSVDCIENRLLIFPNVYQHRVEPFELVDKTKPGHRKILCFLLVDPNNQHTVATDKVPSQQQNQLADAITSSLGKPWNRTPTENSDLTESEFHYTMSQNEAKEVREKMMKERTPEKKDERSGSTAYTSFFSAKIC